jgi:hypothetical protein
MILDLPYILSVEFRDLFVIEESIHFLEDYLSILFGLSACRCCISRLFGLFPQSLIMLYLHVFLIDLS